ncbi:MAG: hypothetical protein ACJ739_04250, partial [Acidimicrobiales bacterium]
GFVAARVARSADTTALKEAASPNGGQGSDNGASQLGQGTLDQSTLGPSTLGQEPDLTLEATQPRPTPQSSSTAGTARPGSPPPTASRPLVAGDTP